MFSNKDELIKALIAEEPTAFVSNYIFDPVPFAFSDNRSAWIAYKIDLAKRIDVDPSEVVLTGSAAVGYSLNPDKLYSQFHSRSDFDIGVVNSHYFDLSWRYLRQLRVEWLSLTGPAKRAIQMHHKNYIFSGTIATNWILSLLPFGRAWQDALDHMSSIAPSAGRDVKLRIYKDFDSLRYYHAKNVAALRDTALSVDEAESEVVINDDEIDRE